MSSISLVQLCHIGTFRSHFPDNDVFRFLEWEFQEEDRIAPHIQLIKRKGNPLLFKPLKRDAFADTTLRALQWRVVEAEA